MGGEEEGSNRRFWETSSMLWFYRFVCFLAIGVVIPMLRCVVQEKSPSEDRCNCALPVGTAAVVC